MKKTTVLLMCLALAAALGPVAALASGSSQAVVNNPNPADRLHLRVLPDASSESWGKYYNGTPVTILEEVNASWVKVYIGDGQGGALGYMSRKYLAIGKAAEKVAPAMPLYSCTSSAWELYDGPTTKAHYRMMGLEAGIQLMGFTPDWWHIAVRQGELTGYIPAKNGLVKNSVAVVNNPNPADRLHLRTQADSKAASLGKYYNGVEVQVLAFKMDGAWAQVRIGSLEGYMDVRYLAMGSAAKKVESAMPQVTVSNEGKTLTLRAGQSTASSSLGRYGDGTAVQVLGIGLTWYHVKVGNVTGFMQMKYLEPKLPK